MRAPFLGVLVAVASVSVLAASGAAETGPVGHGGAGIVSAKGAIGRLQLDRSTAVDVQRFAGAADYLGIGAFRSGGVVPRFLALGYGCRHVQDGGIPTSLDDGTGTRHPRLSGVDCVTVYFVNERTNKLALFTSRSRRFATPLGTSPGMPWQEVRERGPRYVNCPESRFVLGRHAQLFLSNLRGRVFDVGVASMRHPLSLECPEW
jgi:hypothetical protein